jgi:predicted enzyme related to lactoylglutathione lyase
MIIDKIELAWIVVSDIQKAINFYTDILGLQLKEFHKEFGWAELSGSNGGALLGIAQATDKECILPGDNAVITLTVANINEAKEELAKKAVTFIGNIIEIPFVVKLQLIVDQDGNKLQLVESLK